MLSLLVLVGSEWFLNQKPITAPYGTLVKLVKTPAFQAGDDGFEPRRYHQYGSFAQSEERQPVKLWVAGSSPAGIAKVEKIL